MEKNIDPEAIQMYVSQRDDILKIIAEEICNECTEPRKNEVTINYDDPLNCECRCDRIKNLLTTVANIDSDIKLYSSSSS